MQPPNAPSPISVTLSGIVTLVSEVQFWNAEDPTEEVYKIINELTICVFETVIEELKCQLDNMKPDEIVKLFELFEQQVLTRMKDNKTVSTKEVQKPQREKQLQMDEPIDNKKIEELINEFKNKNNITA